MARKATAKAQARKVGRKPPPENETRRDRFQRIGQRRMNDVLQRIRLLGNLSSPQYEYNMTDISQMRATVQGALEDALARFQPRKAAERKPNFRFDDGIDGSGVDKPPSHLRRVV
jgi:hypothetical protein